MTVTNQNCIHEQINSRLNSVNACYHSVQCLLFSRLYQFCVGVNLGPLRGWHYIGTILTYSMVQAII